MNQNDKVGTAFANLMDALRQTYTVTVNSTEAPSSTPADVAPAAPIAPAAPTAPEQIDVQLLRHKFFNDPDALDTFNTAQINALSDSFVDGDE